MCELSDMFMSMFTSRFTSMFIVNVTNPDDESSLLQHIQEGSAETRLPCSDVQFQPLGSPV